MLASDDNFWSLFLMLDYFSRIYFVGVLLIFIWGCWVFLHIMIQIRRAARTPDGFSDDGYLNCEGMQRKLHSIESFAMVLASGCCANQIFGVWFTYMVRATDANPFFALREAWAVSQTLVCSIVLLDALRRIGVVILERHRLRRSA